MCLRAVLTGDDSIIVALDATELEIGKTQRRSLSASADLAWAKPEPEALVTDSAVVTDGERPEDSFQFSGFIKQV